MLLGFLTAFLSVVSWIYRRESRRTMRLFAFSLAVIAGCGLLQGEWALPVMAIAWSMTALIESSHMRTGPETTGAQERRRLSIKRRLFFFRTPRALTSASRISRMFGPAEL